MLLVILSYDYLLSVLFNTIKEPLGYFFIKNLNHVWWNYGIVFIILFFFYKLEIQLLGFIFLFLIATPLATSLLPTVNPSALLVGYNAIHPPLFYTAILLTFAVYNHCDFYFLGKKKYALLFTLSALFLGGLWGAGNSAWGFFWVNDAIELVLFSTSCYLIACCHRGSYINFYKERFIVLLLFTVWILFLRWGFIFTRHSFISSIKIINLYRIFYLFSFSAHLIWLPYFFFCLFSYYMLIYILIYQVFIFFNSKSTFYFLEKTHIILCVLILSWMKFSPYNLSVVINSKQVVYNFFYFGSYEISNYISNINLIINSKKFIITMPSYLIYNYKKAISQFKLFIAWPKFVFVILLLISIRKI